MKVTESRDKYLVGNEILDVASQELERVVVPAHLARLGNDAEKSLTLACSQLRVAHTGFRRTAQDDFAAVGIKAPGRAIIPNALPGPVRASSDFALHRFSTRLLSNSHNPRPKCILTLLESWFDLGGIITRVNPSHPDAESKIRLSGYPSVIQIATTLI